MVLGFLKAKKKVLIVDDDRDQLEILTSILERQGYKVFTATSGEEGVKLSKEKSPDIILMDINMPGLRGDMAALRIRGDETTKQIPIIMLTNVGDLQEKMLTSQAGVTDYVTKPFKPEDLLSKIKSYA